MDKLENQTPETFEANEDKQIESLVEYLEIKSQLDFLASYGFTDIRKNLKFLHKYKYDQEKALFKLEEKQNLDILKRFEKLDLYQKLYPHDKDIDWKKFRQQRKNDRQVLKMKKKEEKYKKLFPDDKEFDWDKFKTNKHLHKKEKKEKKEKRQHEKLERHHHRREKKQKLLEEETPDLDESKDISKIIYKEFYPKDDKVDYSKLKNLKKDTKKKIKEEKYKKFFPDDKEFDWDKFKKEKKSKREKEAELDKKLEEDWNDDFLMFYLDGNNMLYDDAHGGFRNLDFKKLENDISTLAMDFALKKKLNLLTIYFDFTKNIWTKKVEGLEFNVCSARPDFRTSDDALVDMVGRLSASTLNSVVVVTQDKVLKMRLREKGITHLMRPRKFIEIAKAEIGEDKVDKLLPEPKNKLDSSDSGSQHSSDSENEK